MTQVAPGNCLFQRLRQNTVAGTGDVVKKPDDTSAAVEAPQQKDSYDDFELPKKKKKRRPVSTYVVEYNICTTHAMCAHTQRQIF